MTSLCRVRQCQNPQTHLTSAHVCTVCWRTGHGFEECGPGLRHRIRRERLSRQISRTSLAPDLHCEVPGCHAPETHTTSAHFCGRCFSWGGTCLGWPCLQSMLQAPMKQLVTCPICRKRCTPDLTQPLYTGKECCICMAETKLFALVPCGHAQTCGDCIDMMCALDIV